MSILLAFDRIGLAAILIFAGAAKLRNMDAFTRQVAEFLPTERARRLVAPSLPPVELLTGVALLVPATVWLAASASFILFSAFSIAVAVTLLRGQRPSCQCFGQISSAPIGWATFVRNLILTLLALVLVVGRHSPSISLYDFIGLLWSALQKPSSRWHVVLSATVLVCLYLWTLFYLLRQNGRLMLRISTLEQSLEHRLHQDYFPPVATLPIGAVAPGFELLDAERLVTLSLEQLTKPAVLIFSDPGCQPCRDLAPRIMEWSASYSGVLSFVVISRGGAGTQLPHGDTLILLQRDREVALSYGCVGTPGAVLVLRDGTIGSAVAAGSGDIEALVLDFVSQAGAEAARLGTPVHASA